MPWNSEIGMYVLAPVFGYRLSVAVIGQGEQRASSHIATFSRQIRLLRLVAATPLIATLGSELPFTSMVSWGALRSGRCEMLEREN